MNLEHLVKLYGETGEFSKQNYEFELYRFAFKSGEPVNNLAQEVKHLYNKNGFRKYT